MRKARKREHIENYLKTSFKGNNLLSDCMLLHNALPELNFEDIDLSVEFLGKRVGAPIIINAITGGSDFTYNINKELAELAKYFKLPMAVGSQTIAIEDEKEQGSFTIVRETIGDEGVVISNLSATQDLENVEKAIKMINADAIGLHLNVAQELAMEEGDRSFRGIEDNISNIVRNICEPVIIKEVGFGINKEAANRLYKLGIRHIDVAGSGGTNFLEIENLRNRTIDLNELYDWGIPTALSIIETRTVSNSLCIIAGGGIRTASDIAKSIALGASMTSISGEILSYLVHGGYDNAKGYLEGIIYKLKMIMLLTGSKDIEALKNTNYKLSGKLRELIK